MPQFNAGESKTAKATMHNPKGVALDYNSFLYIGDTQVAEVSFSLNAGEEKVVSFPITMPSTAGTFPVLLYVYSKGVGIGFYQATEDVVIVSGSIEIVSIVLNPTSLTNTVHEYNTSLGLGYWGDLFTLGITFANHNNFDVWIHPDFSFGHLNGEPLGYISGELSGFAGESVIYVRLLLDSEYIQGDYSYTNAWQKLYNEQNPGSNMPQFVRDPDGIAVLVAGGDCWLKIPANGQATTVKEGHLGKDISIGLPAVLDLCVAVDKAFYLIYNPHYRTVGGVQYLINWSSVNLNPFVSAVPSAVTIGPPPAAVTIDVLEVLINYTSRSATVKVAITNHTDQTIGVPNVFWVQAYYGERFVRPALGKSAKVIFEVGAEMVLLYSTTQTRFIGTIPPGTTIKTLSYSDGFGSIIYINSSSVVTAYPLATALPVGLKALAWVHFAPGEGVPIADTDAGFKGELSSQLVPFVPTPVEIRWVTGDWYSYWQAYFPEA